jgi:bla regulator protein BlaR1
MISSLSELALAWWHWVVPASIQVAVLAGFVALVDRLLARWTWPQLHSALWLAVVLRFIVPPSLGLPLNALPNLGVNPTQGHGQSPTATLAIATFGLWLVGIFLLGTLTLWRYRGIRREWLTDRPTTLPIWFDSMVRDTARRLGLGRVPRVRIHADLPGPAVLGFFRPVVLVPAALVQAVNRKQIEHVLLHELAHVKRHDPLMALFGLAIQVVFWFHPAVWLARIRLQTLREVGCDRKVAEILGESRREYRHTLLQMARPLLKAPTLGRLGFFAHPSQLLARLVWLERSDFRYAFLKRLASAVSFVLLMILSPPTARSATEATTETVQPEIIAAGELPGCLQLRYAVFGMLAQEEQQAAELQ